METIIATLLLCIGVSFLLISKNQSLLSKTVNIEGVVDAERNFKIIKICGYLLLTGAGLLFVPFTLL